MLQKFSAFSRDLYVSDEQMNMEDFVRIVQNYVKY